MNPIVVGIDGSEQSLKAGRLAAEVAVAANAKLVLVYVVAPIYVGVPPLVIPPEVIVQLQQAGREVLDKAKKALGRADAECIVGEGPPAQTLAQVAAERSASMLVVGTHGTGLAKRVLVGSVADRLVHIAQCPVLVSR